MILGTDMAKHFDMLGKFRLRAIVQKDIDLGTSADRIYILSLALKCSDVGHAAKENELHLKWTDKVCEEFFLQGDVEKERG
jgi:3',5'-cyclic-nucleotide phosphodiesterase